MAVIYGTPQPQNLSTIKAKDRNNYLPLHLQEPRDEQGRRRFHGAFTGGFSAGYFNTVGSKEGWKPADYVSSRTMRQTVTHGPENYMDVEDLEDYRKVVDVNSENEGVKSKLLEQQCEKDIQAENESEFPAAQILGSIVVGVIRQPGDSLSAKLLKAYGLDGRGKDSRILENDANLRDNHGRQGLGYDLGTLYDLGIARKSNKPRNFEGNDPKTKRFKALSFSLFDEDDIIYNSSSAGAYDRYIYNKGDEMSEAFETPDRQKIHTQEKSQAGVISGFVFSHAIQNLKPPHPKVKIPDDYKPQVILSLSLKGTEIKRHDKGSTLQQDGIFDDIGRSVFSYLSAESQKKLAEYLDSSIKSRDIRKQISDKVLGSKKLIAPEASINQDVARDALKGYIPFEDEPQKRDRYFKFLIMHSKQEHVNLQYPGTMSAQDISHEITEFTKAAIMFRKSNSSVASRFTSAKNPQVLGTPEPETISNLRKAPSTESTQAAQAGVYGTLTRTTKPFYPDKLLSKRFNLHPIKPPKDNESSTRMRVDPPAWEKPTTGPPSPHSEHKLEYSLVKEVEKPSIDIFKAIFNDPSSAPSSKLQKKSTLHTKPIQTFDNEDAEINFTRKRTFSPAAFRPIFKSKTSRGTHEA